jgi:hypothetical protein
LSMAAKRSNPMTFKLPFNKRSIYQSTAAKRF